MRRDLVLVFEQGLRERWRLGIGHFHKTRYAARNRRARFGANVGFVGQPRFPKMDLVVYNPGHQKIAGSVYFHISAPGNAARYFFNEAVADVDIAFGNAATVDDSGVAY